MEITYDAGRRPLAIGHLTGYGDLSVFVNSSRQYRYTSPMYIFYKPTESPFSNIEQVIQTKDVIHETATTLIKKWVIYGNTCMYSFLKSNCTHKKQYRDD